MSQNEKDIELIENIIRVLRRCLMIYVKDRDYLRMIETMKDIQKCRIEIKKLNSAEVEKEKNQ